MEVVGGKSNQPLRHQDEPSKNRKVEGEIERDSIFQTVNAKRAIKSEQLKPDAKRVTTLRGRVPREHRLPQ